DFVELFPALETSTAILARRRAKDVWLHERGQSRRLTQNGQTFAAAMFANGDLLLGKRGDDGRVSIWRQDHDGGLKQITAGPIDTRPDISPDGNRWIYVDEARPAPMLCFGNFANACTIARKDGMFPNW